MAPWSKSETGNATGPSLWCNWEKESNCLFVPLFSPYKCFLAVM